MNRLHVCIVFFMFAVTAARAGQTNTLTTDRATSNAAPDGVTSNAAPSTITIDGTTYEGVRWERVTPTTVTIFHKTGVATIPLEKLPTELQQKFGYDPQKAAQWIAAKEKVVREASEQRAKIAVSHYWKLTVEGISPEGIIANGTRGPFGPVTGVIGGRIVTMPATPDYIDIVLVGHPQQGQLAQGNVIDIYAYKEGVMTLGGQTLEKWIYCGYCTPENMKGK